MSAATGSVAFAGTVLRLPDDDWRHRPYDDQRVAVLARGEEAARIAPEVLRTARSVKVFQEEPDWLAPVALPGPVPAVVQRTLARLHLRAVVRDPWTRRRLTPDARFNRTGAEPGRRYYEALQRPGCTLVTWPVYAIVPHGVRSAEGIEHHVDCIIIGRSSAFAADRQPLREDESA